MVQLMPISSLTSHLLRPFIGRNVRDEVVVSVEPEM